MSLASSSFMEGFSASTSVILAMLARLITSITIIMATIITALSTWPI